MITELVKVMADIAHANSPLLRRYIRASQFALLLQNSLLY